MLNNFLGLDALARAKRAADTEKTGIVKRVHYLSVAASQAEEVERAAERDGEEETPFVRENPSGAGARKYRERAQEDHSDQLEDNDQRISDRYERSGSQDRRSDYRDRERHESRQESRGERDRRSSYNDRDRSRRGYRNDYTPSPSPMPSPSPRRSSSGMCMLSVRENSLGFTGLMAGSALRRTVTIVVLTWSKPCNSLNVTSTRSRVFPD